MTLFSDEGERKYLNADERSRFYRALDVIKDSSERSFVELIFWTGCRISEALHLTYLRINVEGASVVFQTLKQHGKNKGKRFRIVPVPGDFMRILDEACGVLNVLQHHCMQHSMRLWPFGRKKGLGLVQKVMREAMIYGRRATARGLRHTFGVTCIMRGVPELRLQIYMGHASLRTTSIYTQLVGMEDRSILSRTWEV